MSPTTLVAAEIIFLGLVTFEGIKTHKKKGSWYEICTEPGFKKNAIDTHPLFLSLIKCIKYTADGFVSKRAAHSGQPDLFLCMTL